MSVNGLHRNLMVCSLLPDRSFRLLDIGCGPLTPSYFYSDKALQVTCVDWKLHRVEPIPTNIECIEGDFAAVELPLCSYDTIIIADVFEHIQIEQESLFIRKCVSILKPGGNLIVSVPHRGTFAWLDPYNVKPTIHHLLWRLALYKRVHNGFCDIRKGHKHYLVEELVEKFKPLQLERAIYWGYFFDPLLSWAIALSRGKLNFSWLRSWSSWEFKREWGKRAFNVALRFKKPEVAE